MNGTRVLKAHRDAAVAAVAQVVQDAARDGGVIDWQAAGAYIAEAVLTAEDGVKTFYVVGERLPSGHIFLYGPYLNALAAEKAIRTGAVGCHHASQLGVFPLAAAPKKTKKRSTGGKK